MSYNGSGTFLINTAGQPVVSGTVISSTAFNALTADLATGLSTAITKDGQTTVTANIPMGTYKFTGLGAGTAATDSANLSQVQSTVTKLLASVSGADTITAVASPTLGAYAAGQMFYFIAAGDNTGAVTLNIDSLGAKSVTRDGSVALAASDLKSGEVVVVVYDGTRFQVVSQLNSAGDARFANVSITSALNVGGVATFTGGTANGVTYLNGSKALTSGSALVFDGTNLGLGVTPSAWDTLRAFDIGSGGALWGTAAQVGIGSNVYYATNNFRYKANNVAAALQLDGNIFKFFTAPSGTAGNTISFTQAMTLDASGNLLVGATSQTLAGTTLQVGAYQTSGTFSAKAIGVYYSTVPAFYSNSFDGSYSVASFGINAFNNSNGSDTVSSSVNGAYFTAFIDLLSSTGESIIRFKTGGNTERARITSGGSLLVGTTTNNARIYSVAPANENAVRGIAQTAGYVGVYGEHSSNSATGYAAYFYNTGSATGLYISNTAAWQSASDERLKTDIKDIDSTDRLMQLRPRDYLWKSQETSDTPDKRNYGFIAQEVQEVFPDLVGVSPDGMFSVEYTGLIAPLVKAVQELKAELDAAKVKIAALEAK